MPRPVSPSQLSPAAGAPHHHARLCRSRCSTARTTGAVLRQQGLAGVAEVERGGVGEQQQQQQGLECGEGGWRCCCSEGLVEETSQGEDEEGGDSASADHAGR